MRTPKLHAIFRAASFAAILVANTACTTAADATPQGYGFDPAERYSETDLRWNRGVGVLRRVCDAMIDRTEGFQYSAVWKVGSDQRYGESLSQQISSTEILTGKTGAATIGRCFLKTWEHTGDARYYEEAYKIARLLAWLQTDYGGWAQVMDIAGYDPDWSSPLRARPQKMSLDDQCTSECIHLFLDLSDVCDDRWLDDALNFALNKMEEHQLANGGWPEWIGDGVPSNSVARNAYINDYVTTDIMNVMLRAGRTQSALKAADFFLEAELQPFSGWAEQYTVDMTPWRARTWEQPEISSVSTSIAVKSLLHIASETSISAYTEPIIRAKQFLQPRVVYNNRWARYYRTTTGRKVYIDRYGDYYDRFYDMPATNYPPGVQARAANRGYDPYDQMHHDEPADALKHIDAFQRYGIENYPESLDPAFLMTPVELGYEIRRLYSQIGRIMGDLSSSDEWVDSSNCVRIDPWERRLGWIFEMLDRLTREEFNVYDFIPDNDTTVNTTPPPSPTGHTPTPNDPPEAPTPNPAPAPSPDSPPQDEPAPDISENTPTPTAPFDSCDCDSDGDIDGMDKSIFRAKWRAKLAGADFDENGKISRKDKKMFMRLHKKQRKAWKQEQRENQ